MFPVIHLLAVTIVPVILTMAEVMLAVIPLYNITQLHLLVRCSTARRRRGL